MGAHSSKVTSEKNQSKTNAPVIHQTLTSTRRASINSSSGEGRERRPSQARDSSDLTRPTVASSGKSVDIATQPRRASTQPRTSTIMEQEPAGKSSKKTKTSSGRMNLFMCCASPTAA